MSTFLLLLNNYSSVPLGFMEGHSERVFRGVILAGKHKGMIWVAGDFVPPIRGFHLVPRRTSTCVVDKVGRHFFTLGNKENAPCGFTCIPFSLLL